MHIIAMVFCFADWFRSKKNRISLRCDLKVSDLTVYRRMTSNFLFFQVHFFKKTVFLSILLFRRRTEVSVVIHARKSCLVFFPEVC